MKKQLLIILIITGSVSAKAQIKKIKKNQFPVYRANVALPRQQTDLLKPVGKATERDDGRMNKPPYRFVYVQRKEPLIDNPPGFPF